MKTWKYAVMDCDFSSDSRISPSSVHKTREAALDQAKRGNNRNPNNHFLAVYWDASMRAKEFWPACIPIEA